MGSHTNLPESRNTDEYDEQDLIWETTGLSVLARLWFTRLRHMGKQQQRRRRAQTQLLSAGGPPCWSGPLPQQSSPSSFADIQAEQARGASGKSSPPAARGWAGRCSLGALLVPAGRSLAELEQEAHRDNYMQREAAYDQRQAAEPASGGETECCVCLEPLAGRTRELSCGHLLHAECAALSLRYSPRCPLCQAEQPAVMEQGQPHDSLSAAATLHDCTNEQCGNNTTSSAAAKRNTPGKASRRQRRPKHTSRSVKTLPRPKPKINE